MPSPSTRCARAGELPVSTTPPSVPPLVQTAAFDVRDLDHLAAIGSGTEKGYIYTRDANPNHEAFGAAIAQLEGAEASLACGSGMGALAAVILSCVKSGDHIVAGRVLYGRSSQLLQRLADSFGVDVTLVDATHPDEFRRALTDRTKLAIVESISNPMLEIADVPSIVTALGEVPLLVDSTFTTPCLFRPLEHGAAWAYHSASKYLNGHGDVTLGVVAGSTDSIAAASETSSMFGMNANPFDCWLATRGLRTLPLRMERVCRTASELADFLANHDTIERVIYPGLKTHPSHDLAESLLDDFGGIISFELKSMSVDAVNLLMKQLDAIPFSPTLADARTTVSHPASTSHRYLSREDRLACGVTDSLVRLSIGLESADDLKTEFDAALTS